MIKKYESMLIIEPTLNEAEAVQENEKLLSLVKELGGEIIETDKWGKRRLAYEIKKKKEGYYFVNYFNAPNEKIKEIDRFYKLSETIIRANLLKLEN